VDEVLAVGRCLLDQAADSHVARIARSRARIQAEEHERRRQQRDDERKRRTTRSRELSIAVPGETTGGCQGCDAIVRDGSSWLPRAELTSIRPAIWDYAMPMWNRANRRT
jgi:hypothetical protein